MTSGKPELRTWNLGQTFHHLWDWEMDDTVDGWIFFSSRLLKQSLIKESKLVQLIQMSTWGLINIWADPLFLGHVVNLDAALHRIRFSICGFVPMPHCSPRVTQRPMNDGKIMPYFYSDTNIFLQDREKQWALLWSVTSSCKIHWLSHLQEKNCCHCPKLQSIQSFWL